MPYVLFSLGVFGFLAALNLTPVVRDLALRFGVVDKPDHRRKLHREPVPRIGGVAILLSYLLAFGATAFGFLNIGFVLPSGSVAIGLLAALGIVFVTGFLDDLFELSPFPKLAAQIAAALVAYFSGVQIHVLHGHPLEMWLSLPLTLIWLIGCTNAFNLIDGLDGLAVGVGLFTTITMLIAALTQQDLALAVATIPLAGALLGFLRYNFNPASIFLGDSGALSIGFFLGCCGVLWGQKSATMVGMAAPLMAMAIPLLDVSLSVMRRFLRRQPIFSPDRRHIHHLLLDRGLTPRRVALLLYGICAIAAVFSLLEGAVHNRFGGLVVLLFCAAAWIGVRNLGYSEFSLASRLLFDGTFRQVIDVRFRLQQFEQSLAGAHTLNECWERIQTGCREFGFTGVRLSLQGEVFETAVNPAAVPSGQFQIRIPLPDSQYVNLYRDAQSDAEATALAGFAGVLQRGINTWLENPAVLIRKTEEVALAAHADSRSVGTPRLKSA